MIGLFQLLEGETFHVSSRPLIVIGVFRKYFEVKIFINGKRFVNFVKIFSLKNPAVRYLKTSCYKYYTIYEHYL